MLRRAVPQQCDFRVSTGSRLGAHRRLSCGTNGEMPDRPGAAPRNPAPAPQTAPKAPPPMTAPTAAPAAAVDIEAVLSQLQSKNPQKLNLRTSIVDLMKLVGMDSSLSERKELADDLHYTGDKNDSAAMNVWLHKEVMKKLAANGGRVPAELMGD